MQLDIFQTRDFVIRPTLKYLGEWRPSLECLLLGTAAGESQFHIFRDDGKPGGLFNISDERHHAIWEQHLAKNPDLASKIRGLASQRQFLDNPNHELCTNLAYATAIAWAIYDQHGFDDLPNETDIHAMMAFWIEYFHYSGTEISPNFAPEQFIDCLSQINTLAA